MTAQGNSQCIVVYSSNQATKYKGDDLDVANGMLLRPQVSVVRY